MNRQQLLTRIETAWIAFRASYDGLSDAQLSELGVTGDWSVKDLIAHVTIWEEEALKHLPHIMEGGRPPRYSVTYGGIDAFNERMVAERSSLPFAEVLRQQADAHQRLLDFVQTIPDEQIATETRTRRRIRLDTYSHYPIHTQAILEWRERQA